MSLGVTIPEIDLALASRYAGISIPVGTPPVLTPVEVFVEQPSSEDYPERVYPSVAVSMLAMVPDFERWHSTDDEHYEEEVGINLVADPPEREMRQVPIPMRVQYSVDTWHRVRTTEERDLLQEVIFTRTHPRGSIVVGPNSVPCWAMWEGGVARLDEVETDETIFHKSLTIAVLADIIPTVGTTIEKTVKRLVWNVSQMETKVDSKGCVVPTGTTITDVSFEVLDTSEAPVPTT